MPPRVQEMTRNDPAQMGQMASLMAKFARAYDSADDTATPAE